MGRGWNKNRKVNKECKVEKPKRDRADPSGYVVVKKENKDFETFYKLQNVVPEEEWSAFMTSLQTSLPSAFRITGNASQAHALNQILIEDFFKPLETLSPEVLAQAASTARLSAQAQAHNGGAEAVAEDAEEPLKPLEPKHLTWYTKGLAYQLNLSRRDIRRCEAYWLLHQCLITETDAGSISRQEAVSMIPPLLMDVEPHHNVLDMCAAPGSKTAQIIEQLHGSSDPVMSAIPPGVVVANDADNKRCYLLTHQAKRLQSPSIIITNHDAAFMPNMFYTKPDGSTGKLKYDRILCDVPCSGDGTMRKNCDIWSKWNPVNGCNLHGLQLRIARRGLELLKVGGRMVYSTCSLSPMENEAVLQRLLLEANGAVHIVDCTDKLPGLKFRGGLRQWTVVSKEMQVLATPADIPVKQSNVYHKHLFPSEKDVNLERCLRLLPHHQDTGGFFVAVLEKTAPMPGEKVETPAGDTTVAADGAKTNVQRGKKQTKRHHGFKEEPYFYLSDSISKWEEDYKAGKPMTPVITTSATPVPAVVEEIAAETNGTTVAVAATNAAEVASEETAAAEGTPATTTTEGTAVVTEDTVAMEVTGRAAPAAAATLDFDQDDLCIWSSVTTFFGWRKDLPEATYANFMTRSREGKKRNLYFTNTLVRNLIDRNQDRMKIINTGVKVLVRTDNKGATCDFRLAQEGIQSLVPLITERRVPVTRADLLLLLNDDDNDIPPDLAVMSAPCQQTARPMVTGSVLLEYSGDPTVAEDLQDSVPQASKIQIALVGWKGKSSMRCYVVRSDRVHYLRLLRADTSKYVKNKFVAASERIAAAAAASNGGADDVGVVATDGAVNSANDTTDNVVAGKDVVPSAMAVDEAGDEEAVKTKKPKLDLKSSIDEKMDT